MTLAMDDAEKNRLQLNIQREYAEFLDDADRDNVYMKKIKEMIEKKSIRLIVNINDLRKTKPVRCKELLENGFDEMPLVQKALREVIGTIDAEFVKGFDEFFVGLEGSFGGRHVTPRILTSRYLGNTVCVEGIVTKCSTIHPKIIRSVHYCPVTKKSMERRYADMASFDIFPTSSAYPTKDDDGNLLETEYGLSKYRDHQTMTIQEMPEKAPTGQLPRSIDIILDDDLVDLCKPGDRILVVGVYRILPGKQGGFTSGVFRSVILANSITLMSKDANLTITVDDVKACKKFSRTMNPFETLAKSLAPSIHGHEYIKKAILCLLLGGVEKVLPNGTRLRGDINILLIGDPSVAKSQMLRYVSNIAPRVVMTTGRGSSGVGLTAAVTTDMESGERRLEAGAMVLADRGIVCIDEFDKMSDADRTAIHEVMEQGRVTIAKAGIHARLNARTAVLAAANPVYGRYDEYKSPMDNIGLQDSLLSRFDLLFIVLDQAEQELDRTISEHVLRMHRFRNANEQDGEATPLFQSMATLSTRDLDEDHQNEKTEVYEKYDAMLHGRGRTRGDKILSMEFMKKYVHIAKCIKPQLTSEASKAISEEYSKLRVQNKDDSHIARTQPVTARSLETMIRLSTAHARARMSKVVNKDDALAAIELVQFAYFKRVLEKEKKKRRRQESGEPFSGSDTEAEENDENERPEGEEGEERPSQRRSKRIRPSNDSEDPYNAEGIDDDEDSPGNLAEMRGKKKDITQPEVSELMETEPAVVHRIISDTRMEVFKQKFLQLFSMEREESLKEDKVTEWLTTDPNDFTKDEVLGGLDRMVEDGKVFLSEGFVFLI
ncbi:unnamed protein product [Allacma fusca]|uniref:DNA helicase n=1 Tax=Allacma fusca TaxID=39272 RepID=A0A8J2KHE5_9HEXA|nr:unnamed protein product [Allacma fusca]